MRWLPVTVILLGACLPDLPADPPAAAASSCGDGTVDLGREDCDPGSVGATGCSATCRIACEGTLVAGTGHCYFAVGSALSFAEAAAACRARGAHLVTVTHADEGMQVATGGWVDLTRSVAAGAYVTSLPDEPGAPAAPTTGPCPGCFAPGVLDADCVAWDGAAFVGVACTADSARTVTCEREPAGSTAVSCGTGLCVPLRSGRTLVVSVAPTTYEQARVRCSELGGRPWVISSEHTEVARELSAIFGAGEALWVGLTREGATWISADGQATAPPWGDRQPGAGDAAVLVLAPGAYDTTLLRAEVPAAKHPAVCEPN